MPVATETVILQLKPGKTITEAGSPDSQALKGIMQNTASQEGFIRQFWGLQIENPTTFIWTIDWEDVSEHQKFINSDKYAPFLAQCAEVFDLETQKPIILHANLTNDSVAAREAPTTEFCFFMIPVGSDDATKSALEDAFLGITKKCLERGATHNAVGWTMEQMKHPDTGPTLALQGLTGWPDMQTHTALREDADFMDTVGKLRAVALPPVPGRGMFHVQLRGKA